MTPRETFDAAANSRAKEEVASLFLRVGGCIQIFRTCKIAGCSLRLIISCGKSRTAVCALPTRNLSLGLDLVDFNQLSDLYKVMLRGTNY